MKKTNRNTDHRRGNNNSYGGGGGGGSGYGNAYGDRPSYGGGNSYNSGPPKANDWFWKKTKQNKKPIFEEFFLNKKTKKKTKK